MNKRFFIISIIMYILNAVLVEAFNINTHNSLYSAIFFIALLIPLCIGCIINSILYKERNSMLRFLFYYLTFMCSLGILLISTLTFTILKDFGERLVILFIYFLLSIASLIGYLIFKKCDLQNKKIFRYFFILFATSLLINLILIIVF